MVEIEYPEDYEMEEEVWDEEEALEEEALEEEAPRRPAPKKKKKSSKRRRRRNRAKWIVLAVLLVVLAAAAFLLFSHKVCVFHAYSEAGCTERSTCKYCGKTKGEPLGHAFVPATCTEAEYCTRCGKEFGTPLDHNFEETDCTIPAVCTLCGAVNENTHEHTFVPAMGSPDMVCSCCGVKKAADDQPEQEAKPEQEPNLETVIEIPQAPEASEGGIELPRVDLPETETPTIIEIPGGMPSAADNLGPTMTDMPTISDTIRKEAPNVKLPEASCFLVTPVTRNIFCTEGFFAYRRLGPSENWGIMNKVNNGVEVTVFAQKDRYSLVKTAGGYYGWVFTRYLTDPQTPVVYEPDFPEAARKAFTVKTQQQTNLRYDPFNLFPVKSTLDKGTVLTVTAAYNSPNGLYYFVGDGWVHHAMVK